MSFLKFFGRNSLDGPSSAEPRFGSTSADGESSDPVRPSRAIEGYVDQIDSDRIVGWAFDANAPGRKLLIRVSAGDLVVVGLANLDRPDLRRAGKGDGLCGFDIEFALGEVGGQSVRVREAETGTDLFGSPFNADLPDLLASPANRERLDCLRSEAQLARFETQGADGWASDLAHEGGLGYPTRGRVEKLFDSAQPDHDPEGLITRYVEFELHRCRMEASLFVGGDVTERLKVLHWYLVDYGTRRGAGMPLSAAQLTFLNAPTPIFGLGREFSVAAYNFILQERPALGHFENDSVVREALFWWCAERVPRLTPEGQLITQAQVEVLTHMEERDVGKHIRLNPFVRKIHETDPALAVLDLRSVLDRAVLIAVLMLRSIRKPFIARLLPRTSVAELIDSATRDKPSHLDRMIALAFGPERNLGAAQVADLTTRLRDGTRWGGVHIIEPDETGRSAQKNAGPCFRSDPNIRSGLEPGVAVFGPVQVGSGLGQAMRLSIDILRRAGRDPAVFDFGLDNPAPTGFASLGKISHLRAPRQINLLHLNGDTIPLAFANLDKRLFERSYNIGFMFWELDKVPKFHRLALDLLDEIWVASDYNRETYARVADIPVHNVGMAVCELPELVPVNRRDLGLREGVFTFLATFDSFSFIERKNPHGVIDAFRAAFPLAQNEPVALVLKTHNRRRVGDPHQVRIWQSIDAAIGRDPRIRIVDQTLSYPDVLRLKQACDAYVSLHRSEGLGFGMLEAMQLGVPVIATAYSGNMEFCSPETAFLVEYDLVAPTPAEYPFAERGSHWAQPSLASAAAAMREVYENYERGQERAETARSRVYQDFSLDAIARRYNGRLTAIDEKLVRVIIEGH